jgi:hypothetical protein
LVVEYALHPGVVLAAGGYEFGFRKLGNGAGESFHGFTGKKASYFAEKGEQICRAKEAVSQKRRPVGNLPAESERQKCGVI